MFWVHAGTRQRIEKDYLDIAQEVGIPGWESPEFDRLDMVKDWFERRISGRWILILDNADDIDMLYGDHSRLADFFPRGSNGAILLTTRNKKVGVKFTGSDQKLIHVQSLPKAASVLLLKSKLNAEFGEEQYADLATALCNVPLALVQAAAFIMVESTSISEYLRMYHRSDDTKIQLLGDDFEDDTRDKETQNAVSLTLIMSFEQIKDSDPLAAEILSFMCMLDPQAIPKSLLPGAENPVVFTRALGTLEAFSLINKSSQPAQRDQFYDLHRLVRLVMTGYLRRSDELNQSMRDATLIMLDRFPDYRKAKNHGGCRMLYPHAAVILSSLETANGSVSCQVTESSNQAGMEKESDLLLTIAEYLRDKGERKLALSMMERSFAIRTRVLGPEHQQTLGGAERMVSMLLEYDNAEDAVQLGRTTLRRAERALGQDHACTLRNMCSLALSLTRQRVHKEAGEMLQRAWKLAQTSLGDEHPLTLRTVGSLSICLDEQGKHEEAERLMRTVLAGQTKVLGEEDADTLSSIANLSRCLSRQNRHAEAQEMIRLNLPRLMSGHGEEHPHTLTSWSKLTYYLDNQKRFDEAEELVRKMLRLQPKVLDDERSRTMIIMSDVAYYLS